MSDRTFARKKATASNFSPPSLVSPTTPTLANPIRGFGLTNNFIQTQSESSTKEQELPSVDEVSLEQQIIQEKPLGHDISRISFRRPQPKLTVGEPGDKYEQEADWMANRVMRMLVPNRFNAPTVQPVQNYVQRKSAISEQEQEKVGTLLSIQLAPEQGLQVADIESRLNSSKGGGSPLPEAVRSFMEPRFGADFSSVRVHTDSTAVQMNQGLSAQAFTHGSDIYFGEGKSPGNNELTAHELTHVVQQTGTVQTKHSPEQPTIQMKCASSEKEDVEVQRSPNISSVSDPEIQRWSLFSDDEDKQEAEGGDSSGGVLLDWSPGVGAATADLTNPVPTPIQPPEVNPITPDELPNPWEGPGFGKGPGSTFGQVGAGAADGAEAAEGASVIESADAVEGASAVESAGVAEGAEGLLFGLGAAELALFAGAFVAGAGLPFLIGYAIDKMSETGQQPDPDEASPPGGAPPQSQLSSDEDAGVTPSAQLPGQGGSTPAIDPNTGFPIQVPADQPATPINDPSNPNQAQLPGQSNQDPMDASGNKYGPVHGPVLPVPYGPVPAKIVDIASKIPGATPGPPVMRGDRLKRTVIIDGKTYVGGDPYNNRELRLPVVDEAENIITYTEYDVNPLPAPDRGDERIVIGSDGTRYYTSNHYRSFIEF